MFEKGHPQYNTGRTYFKKGHIPWIKNKHHTEETKTKISETRLKNKEELGYINSLATREKLSEGMKNCPGFFKGKHHSKASKLAMSKSHKGQVSPRKGKKYPQLSGESNPNWIDGRSFLPYPVEFNRQLKELIRNRDNYQCQKCGMPKCENMMKFSVHHIDYNKKNCLPSNLVSLCKRCNSLVNINRKCWKIYFQSKIAKLEETRL